MPVKTTASDSTTPPADGPIERNDLIKMASDMQRALRAIDKALKDASTGLTFENFSGLQGLADGGAETAGGGKQNRLRPPQRRALVKQGFISQDDEGTSNLTDAGRAALASGNQAFDTLLEGIQSGKVPLTQKRAALFARLCGRIRIRSKAGAGFDSETATAAQE